MAELQEKSLEFAELLLDEEVDIVVAWVRGILEQGESALQFFNQVFTPALSEVGDRFGRLEIFLPELIDAAERARAVSEQVIKPGLAEMGSEVKITRGKVVICSVKGDLHDIGKNMVALMLQVNGFEVLDLGVDVAPREAIEQARKAGANILGLSSLMTTSMPYMKECVELRDGFGLKDKFKIIVGGAPITPLYSQQIGADAYGRNAVEGVQNCIGLLEGGRG